MKWTYVDTSNTRLSIPLEIYDERLAFDARAATVFRATKQAIEDGSVIVLTLGRRRAIIPMLLSRRP